MKKSNLILGCEACGGYFSSDKGGEFKASSLIPGPECEWTLRLDTTEDAEIVLTFKVLIHTLKILVAIQSIFIPYLQLYLLGSCFSKWNL